MVFEEEMRFLTHLVLPVFYRNFPEFGFPGFPAVLTTYKKGGFSLQWIFGESREVTITVNKFGIVETVKSVNMTKPDADRMC